MVRYDYDKGVLYVKGGAVSFNLHLRMPVTIISGETATGKTLLCRTLKMYKQKEKEEGIDYGVSDIEVFTDGIDFELMKTFRSKLIVIDRCDDYMTRRIAHYIKSHDCRHNHYLMMGRAFRIIVSPNYIGEFKRQGNNVVAAYKFSVHGWW